MDNGDKEGSTRVEIVWVGKQMAGNSCFCRIPDRRVPFSTVYLQEHNLQMSWDGDCKRPEGPGTCVYICDQIMVSADKGESG